MTFRIFTNDVGPNAYSCLTRSNGKTAEEALDRANEENSVTEYPGVKTLAILDDSEALERYGPHGQTGKLPPAYILDRGRKVGSVAGPRRYGR